MSHNFCCLLSPAHKEGKRELPLPVLLTCLLRSFEPSPYERLKGKSVLRVIDGESVDVASLIGENERVVMVFGRSFG